MTAEALPALNCACASLRRAARAVTQLYDAALKDTGLTVSQLTLLRVLSKLGPSPQGALGDFLALDPTTLSRSLRPLQRAGWIRVARGQDRREVRWALTASGRGRLTRALPAWERVQARLRKRLRSEQWSLLINALAMVAAAARVA